MCGQEEKGDQPNIAKSSSDDRWSTYKAEQCFENEKNKTTNDKVFVKKLFRGTYEIPPRLRHVGPSGSRSRKTSWNNSSS